MTDLAIQNAVTTRDECLAKIAAAEKQIAEWRAKSERAERFIEDWKVFSGEELPTSQVAERVYARSEPSTSPKPRNPKKEEVAEAAREIIVGHGSPMTRDQLFKVLPDKGITIHGQNPPVVLQTMLWRMKDRVVHLKGHGYWPQDLPYEEANYDPARPEPTESEAEDEDHDLLG